MANDRQFGTTWVHSQGRDRFKAFGGQIGHFLLPSPDSRVELNAANMQKDKDFLGCMLNLPANKQGTQIFIGSDGLSKSFMRLFLVFKNLWEALFGKAIYRALSLSNDQYSFQKE